MTVKAVIYYRDRQGGKSLQYQQDLAKDWAESNGWQIIDQAIETEFSTTRNTRRELRRLLKIAQLAKAVLFIPCFGQLSRNADAIGAILAHKVKLVAPDVSSLRDPSQSLRTLEIMASVAEFELAETKEKARNAYEAIREEIEQTGSHKTKRGKVIKKLGNLSSVKKASEKAKILRKVRAETYAADMEPTMRRLANRGCRSSSDFAKSLTALGVSSPNGKLVWTASMARNLMRTLGIEPQPRVKKPEPPQYGETLIDTPADPDEAMAQIKDAIRRDPSISIEALRRRYGISYGIAQRLKDAAR
jgi:DNA invertase Pin-like site-specific DNA recombinase